MTFALAGWGKLTRSVRFCMIFFVGNSDKHVFGRDGIDFTNNEKI